jgi:thiol-disulfide isomerase/thioredoxin
MTLRSIAAVCALLALQAAPASAAGSGAQTLEPLVAAGDWLNGAPSAHSLAGKVVIVDVFTFACYNCKNVTPNLRALYKQRGTGLEIVGVHAPETKYESDRANVVEQLKAQGILWPVAIDNDFALWHAYGVEYWPTQLIFDRHGRLRKTVIGDSQDQLVDATVKALLAER